MPYPEYWDSKERVWRPAGGPSAVLVDSPVAVMHSGAEQTLAAGWQNVQLDSTSLDSNGFADLANDRFVIPPDMAGPYHIEGYIAGSISLNARVLSAIALNGTILKGSREDMTSALGSMGFGLHPSVTKALAAGDILTLRGYSNNGSQIISSASDTDIMSYFALTRLAAGTPGPRGPAGPPGAGGIGWYGTQSVPVGGWGPGADDVFIDTEVENDGGFVLGADNRVAVPVDGWYHVYGGFDCGISNDGSYRGATIALNGADVPGTLQMQIGNSANYGSALNTSAVVKCLAGDHLSIRAVTIGTSATIGAGALGIVYLG